MAQPTPYVPSFDFSDFSTLNPDTPQPGVSLDAQFNAIKLTTDEVLENLALIQRDDGLLANGIVTADSLSDELYAGISRAIPWATATSYLAGDLVWYSSKLYAANSDHTSTTNPTVDTTKWTLVLDMTATVPDVITQSAQDAADAAAASAAAAAASATSVTSVVNSVTYLWAGTATGAANTLVLTPVPTMTSYGVGHKLRFLVGTTNTNAVTMNTDNALGSTTIKKSIGGALVNLVAGDLVASTIAEIEYISGAAGYQLLNPATYSQGASVASATTVNLDTATGDYVSITGTTTITGITLAQGRERTVTFAAALTLTHGASLLLKNNGSNIVTAAGDSAVFRGEASGVVRMISYTPASGTPVGNVGYSKITSADIATTAEIIAGTASKLLNAAGLAPLFYGTSLYAGSSTSSGTPIAFNNEDYDDGGWHDTVTNNSRITPNVAGRFLFVFNLIGTLSGNATYDVVIRKNGSTNIARINSSDATSQPSNFSLSAIDTANGTTDYYEVMFTSAGFTMNNGTTGTRFQAIRLR